MVLGMRFAGSLVTAKVFAGVISAVVAVMAPTVEHYRSKLHGGAPVLADVHVKEAVVAEGPAVTVGALPAACPRRKAKLKRRGHRPALLLFDVSPDARSPPLTAAFNARFFTVFVIVSFILLGGVVLKEVVHVVSEQLINTVACGCVLALLMVVGMLSLEATSIRSGMSLF